MMQTIFSLVFSGGKRKWHSLHDEKIHFHIFGTTDKNKGRLRNTVSKDSVKLSFVIKQCTVSLVEAACFSAILDKHV
jgi:hypothetical protein